MLNEYELKMSILSKIFPLFISHNHFDPKIANIKKPFIQDLLLDQFEDLVKDFKSTFVSKDRPYISCSYTVTCGENINEKHTRFVIGCRIEDDKKEVIDYFWNKIKLPKI